MKPLARNALILTTGLSSIAGGAGFGWEMSSIEIEAAALHAQKFAHCAGRLATAASGAALPPECHGAVVYAQPERHPRLAAMDYSLPAADYRVDKQAYNFARADVTYETKKGLRNGIIMGMVFWGMGLYLGLVDKATRQTA